MAKAADLVVSAHSSTGREEVRKFLQHLVVVRSIVQGHTQNRVDKAIVLEALRTFNARYSPVCALVKLDNH